MTALFFILGSLCAVLLWWPFHHQRNQELKLERERADYYYQQLMLVHEEINRAQGMFRQRLCEPGEEWKNQ